VFESHYHQMSASGFRFVPDENTKTGFGEENHEQTEAPSTRGNRPGRSLLEPDRIL